MKKTKILASFILSMAILASCFSTLRLSAETADVSEAISALKDAWSGLAENKTEVLAIPAADQRRETATATDLTDEEKAAFGEYYFNEEGKGYNYIWPVGQSGYKDYSGKSNVRYSFAAKIANASEKFEVNIAYGSPWSWKGLFTTNNQNLMRKYVFNAENVEGIDIRKINAIQIKNENNAKMYLGCIYVSYDEPIALPENCDSFTTADQWAEAVSKLDLTNITVTDSFKNAFAELRKYTTDFEALAAFETQYSALTKNVTEVYAIPHASFRHSTAELSDEEKAAFGEYYYQNTDNSENEYTYPEGQTSFADLSGKLNVKYTFKYKQDSVGNFQVKLFYTKADGTKGDINSWNGKYAPYSDRINTLLTYTLDTAGTDISRNVRFRLAPNGRKLTAGCIYASYDDPIGMPANYEFFTAENWLNTVYNTDFTEYTVTDEFKAAFKALESYTEEGKKLSDLKEAYGSLKNTKTELFAVPYKPTAKVTADNTELTQAEKEALGPYYYYSDTAGETYFMNPKTESLFGYPSYAGKENLKYIYTYKLDYGNSEDRHFELVFENTSKQYYGIWIQKGGTDIIKGSYNAIEGSRDISSVNSVIIKNPIGHKIILGCIYASYDEPIAAPLNYELFSAEKLINAIYNTDLSAYNLTEEFKTAFNGMKTVSALARADVNADYSFNSEDLAVLRQVLLEAGSDCNGDINGNGKADILDLIKIKKLLVNVK